MDQRKKTVEIALSKEEYWNPRPGCPRLFMAPMEGVCDVAWRKAYSRVIGGMDELSTEFIRISRNGNAKSLSKAYQNEGISLPVAAQIMGEDPQACLELALEIEKRGAPRIDLNCGCPSNRVVGHGAGSSLLQNPDKVYEILSLLTQHCSLPISVKMRSGYKDTSLFSQNIEAACAAGVQQIALHPRTREQGYRGCADWDLIKKAKEISRVPIVASGDVTSAEKALLLYQRTGCDGIMIGRGSLVDPWLFWSVRALFAKTLFCPTLEEELCQLQNLASSFLEEIQTLNANAQAGRIKQWIRFLSQGKRDFQRELALLLSKDWTAEELIDQLLSLWSQNGHSSSSSR